MHMCVCVCVCVCAHVCVCVCVCVCEYACVCQNFYLLLYTIVGVTKTLVREIGDSIYSAIFKGLSSQWCETLGVKVMEQCQRVKVTSYMMLYMML